MLKIEHLTKKYGDKTAVWDLSLHISKGDIYGFIGHNGAGKTTTIKAIVGIHDYEEGTILVDGISVKEQPLECKNRIAYIPDNPDIFEYLTGIQYLNFTADIYGVSKAEREQNIRKYADMFEITPALGDLVSSYSHGMKQKLALAMAFLEDPQILILDEPLSALDADSVEMAREQIAKERERGKLILLASHYAEDIQVLCDVVYKMDGGRCQ